MHITQANTLESYETLYGSEDLVGQYLEPSRLAFYEEVAEVCALLAPGSAIDVGCGTGHLLLALTRRLAQPCAVTGVDYSPQAIRRAEASIPGGRWIVSDIDHLRLVERFDLVLCTEVLEHLEDPVRAVEVLESLQAPGGSIVVTVPDGALDRFEGHVQFWTEDEFAAFLRPHGLVELRRLSDVTLLAVLRSPARGPAASTG